MRELLKHYIDGHWVESEGGRRYEVINPATEEPCAAITLGSQADVDVSASTSQRWTYWNTRSATAFVEYTHTLSPDWEAKLTAQQRHGEESTKLLYAYSPYHNVKSGVAYPAILATTADTDDRVVPGHTASAVTPVPRSSSLSASVQCSTNAFVAE